MSDLVADAPPDLPPIGFGTLGIADVDRDEFTLATKIWYDRLRNDDVLDPVEGSLDRLGVDTIGLLYVYWPLGDYDPEETLAAYNELVVRGTVSNIDVSTSRPRFSTPPWSTPSRRSRTTRLSFTRKTRSPHSFDSE